MYYDNLKPDCTVDVLGTQYSIYLNVPEDEDEVLKACAGYCDKTVKRIAVVAKDKECNLGNHTEYQKYLIRHELIHAFLFESGIGGDTVWDIDGQEHPEHMVEWIGMQFPKLLKAFQEVGVI